MGYNQYMATTRESGRGRTAAILVLLALLAALALRGSTLFLIDRPLRGVSDATGIIRYNPWSDIGVRLVGGPDAYYHLRRARLAAYGADMTFDHWTDYPAGSVIHWPQTYDRLLGFFYGNIFNCGLLFMKLVPVAAGMLAVLAGWLVLRRRFGDLAWYPLLVLALAPAAVFPTVYAAIDHHCAEILFSLLALAGIAVGGKIRFPVMLLALTGAWASAPSWPFIAALLVAGNATHYLPARAALVALLLVAVGLLAGSSIYLADPWLAAVAEAQPLLSAGTLFRAVVALSPGFLMLPVACLWWWRARHDGAAAGLLAMTMLALPLTLIEARFTIFLILPAAAALMETMRWLYQRGARQGALVMAALCLLPLARGLAELPDWAQDVPGAFTTARWLRQHVVVVPRYGLQHPAWPGDLGQPQIQPAFGVAARWDWGHHLLAVGDIPVAANPFHTGVGGRNLAHGIFFSDPATATALADSANIRVLALEDFAASGYANHYRDAGNVPLYRSLWYRLYYDGADTLGWRLRGAFTADGVKVQIWTRAGWPAEIAPIGQ